MVGEVRRKMAADGRTPAKRTTTAAAPALEAHPGREGDDGLLHGEIDWKNDSDQELDTDDAGDAAARAPCFQLYRHLQKQRWQERRQ